MVWNKHRSSAGTNPEAYRRVRHTQPLLTCRGVSGRGDVLLHPISCVPKLPHRGLQMSRHLAGLHHGRHWVSSWGKTWGRVLGSNGSLDRWFQEAQLKRPVIQDSRNTRREARTPKLARLQRALWPLGGARASCELRSLGAFPHWALGPKRSVKRAPSGVLHPFLDGHVGLHRAVSSSASLW